MREQGREHPFRALLAGGQSWNFCANTLPRNGRLGRRMFSDLGNRVGGRGGDGWEQ